MVSPRAIKKKGARVRGMAVPAMLGLMGLVFLLGVVVTDVAVRAMRQARRDETRAVTASLADAAQQRILLQMWTPFADSQQFGWLDPRYIGAGAASNQRKGVLVGVMNGGRYASSVISYRIVDSYTRDITLRSVGWLDLNNSGGSEPDAGEPASAQEQRVRLFLRQAHVFDYAYFVNNYGWMTGFTQSNLQVNGDMRANGDFACDGGMVNGQIIGAPNANLRNGGGGWGATGRATITNTVNLSNSAYASSINSRARQGYSAAQHGLKTDDSFNTWKDVLYDQTPDATVGVGSDIMYGSVIADNTGTRQLSNQTTRFSSDSTTTLPMPDLSDIAHYRNDISAVYNDSKPFYADGSINPQFNQPASVEVWDTATNAYRRLSGQAGDPPGVVSGSAALIGTAAHPIRLHGPVTVTGDIAIKGIVQGQGTLYAGRNVHVLGDVKYADPPSFAGSDPTAIDNANEKRSMLALCARGSVMMGNTKNFTTTSPLNYMKPPFTQDRKDASGNLIAAFDATQPDAGYTMQGGGTPKKYQSLFGDTWVNANAGPVTQIDAVLYTNNCAGGLVGGGSTGLTINGSIISKDEAMVVNLSGGGRMTMNYDARIKERSLQERPLIDIDLPRTPDKRFWGWREALP